jgi:choline monooxygenase
MDPALEALIRSYDALAPLERAETPPAAWYLDPRVYDLERERVFFRSWQAVGHVHEVERPGAYFTLDLAGEPLVVVRGQDGALRAFVNVCRHRGSVVARGAGVARSLNCPYHGWVYGLDGRLTGGPPEFEGVECFDRARSGLPRVRVETFGPFVFVNLDPAAPPLSEALGDIPAPPPAGARPIIERRVYEVECNWKLYVDNYLEGYHVPHVHPALHAVLDYSRYVTEPRGPRVLQWAPTRAAAGGGAAEYAAYAPAGTEGRYWWAFPAFMLNVYANNFSGNYIRPLGPERTLCVFDFFFSRAEDVAPGIAASDEVQQEDMRICTSVQAGLRSRTYRAGRYSVARENGLRHFHTLLARALRRA